MRKGAKKTLACLVLFSGKFKLGKRPLHAERRPRKILKYVGKMTLISLTNNYSNNRVVAGFLYLKLGRMGQEERF